MAARIDATWVKFAQSYGMTDDTIACFSATALNPIYKWNYFCQALEIGVGIEQLLAA